ncbi:MAG: flagellar basal body rod C-terminal domain-containing protein, partial [Pseudolabrys sp.]
LTTELHEYCVHDCGFGIKRGEPASAGGDDPTAPYADGRGMVASPNVDLANELVQVLVARFSYAANAQVIRVDAQMSTALFDITA